MKLKSISKSPLSKLIVVLGSLSVAIILPSSVYGVNSIQAGALAARGTSQPLSLFGVAGVFTVITNAMLFLIGALSVLMLIVGGFKYVISGGDTTAINNAKNTILYALVGLVVGLLAYAVINFVLVSLIPN